jgi:hypothetical protein
VSDPVAGLRLLAGQLTVAYSADPGNALLARVLLDALRALMPKDGNLDGELREFLAGFSSA